MAFGYTSSDAESEHALVFAENAIYAAQQTLIGPVLSTCTDCWEAIPKARVLYLRAAGMRCTRCLGCQGVFDGLAKAKIKMLDRVL